MENERHYTECGDLQHRLNAVDLPSMSWSRPFYRTPNEFAVLSLVVNEDGKDDGASLECSIRSGIPYWHYGLDAPNDLGN